MSEIERLAKAAGLSSEADIDAIRSLDLTPRIPTMIREIRALCPPTAHQARYFLGLAEDAMDNWLARLKGSKE